MFVAPMSRSVETEKAIFEYDGEIVLRIHVKEDAVLEIDDIKEMDEAGYELVEGKPHVILVIPGKRSSATHDAMKYAAKKEKQGRIAEASVIASLSTRLLAKFYHAVIRPTVPSRYFSNETEALEWLREEYDKGVNGSKGIA